MSAVITHRLVDLARALEAAPRGQRTALCKEAALELGLSLATLYRKLEDVNVTTPRKRRSDAGKSALSLEEARLISAMLIESIRANDKQLSTLERAVERLRSNGLITAGQVDDTTGDVSFLSESAIARALRGYNLHPEQILQPKPAVELASKHPNHVWQVDASISTQFYLGDDGLKPMHKAEYYDGKPENLKRIERQRLWRYVITDHTSGTIYLQYVLGAESAENLCNVLISAMQKRAGNDPFHGVPFIMMTDPGAAMTSAMFRNLCKALSIELIINKVGNARAKGQVEQAHNIVERDFESGLKLIKKPETLDEINALAAKWMVYHNAVAIHSRHRSSRYSAWLKITAEQLRLAPAADVCRELAISSPELRKVNTKLRVSFRGHEFDVSNVPDVMVGQKLLITRNPWRDQDSAQVVLTGENGREQFLVVDRVVLDDWGFATTAASIGESFKAHTETPAEIERKALDQLATGANTMEGVEKARKAKAVPFAGAIDPFKHIDNTLLPSFMPKRGTEHKASVDVSVEIKPLSHVAAAKVLRREVKDWSAQSLAWLKSNYPDGVPEAELENIANTLNKPARTGLRLVGGDAC